MAQVDEGFQMPDLSAFEGFIDQTTFGQILEMDDEESREFSKSIVFGYFDQAESTFEDMHGAMYVTPMAQFSGNLAGVSFTNRQSLQREARSCFTILIRTLPQGLLRDSRPNQGKRCLREDPALRREERRVRNRGRAGFFYIVGKHQEDVGRGERRV